MAGQRLVQLNSALHELSICFKGVHDYVSPNDDRLPSIFQDSEWEDDWERVE